MMFGHELIESLHFIAPHRPCVQMDEDLLFIGCGLAKGGDFFLVHVRQHKKLRPACPAKSVNAFPFSGFPLPKNAPYGGALLPFASNSMVPALNSNPSSQTTFCPGLLNSMAGAPSFSTSFVEAMAPFHPFPSGTAFRSGVTVCPLDE